MADIKLKNCPVCNKPPILEKFPVPIEHCYSGYLWTVVSGCGVQMQGYGDKDTTINKWNVRPLDSTIEAQEAEINRLGEIINICLIGGNHLAHILIKNLGADFCDKYPYLADNMEILERLRVGDNYDIWCAWSQMMKARDGLAEKGE